MNNSCKNHFSPFPFSSKTGIRPASSCITMESLSRILGMLSTYGILRLIISMCEQSGSLSLVLSIVMIMNGAETLQRNHGGQIQIKLGE